MGLALGAGHIQFRGGKAGGQRVEQGAGVGLAADDLQQAAARVGAVIEAVPAFLEEDVTAHLAAQRSEEHTSELQSPCNLVCRLLLEKKKMLILLNYSRYTAHYSK